MVAQTLLIHALLVKAFLAFILTAIVVVPFFAKQNPLAFKKASFIYTMIYQALLTMIAFSGIVALFLGNLPWGIGTILMVVVWAALMFIEIKKYKLIKTTSIQDEARLKLFKGAFIKIAILQLLLVVMMVVMMILKAKGILAIS